MKYVFLFLLVLIAIVSFKLILISLAVIALTSLFIAAGEYIYNTIKRLLK